MSVLNTALVNITDTAAMPDLPKRAVIAPNGSLYFVTRADADQGLHVIKEKDGTNGATEFVSGAELTSDVTQAMIACDIDSSGVLHIVYLTYHSGAKKLRHLRFDTVTDQWITGTTTIVALTPDALVAGDAVDVQCVGTTVHAVCSAKIGSFWNVRYYRYENAVWSLVLSPTSIGIAPAYGPLINVNSTGEAIVLYNKGVSDLTVSQQWYMMDTVNQTESAIAGLGPATIINNNDDERHIVFTGDKRHTIIRSAAISSTLGAIQFEGPDLGGIVDGSVKALRFGLFPDGDQIHGIFVADGKLYQTRYHDGVWDKARIVADLQATVDSLGAAQLASPSVGVIKLDGSSWLTTTLDASIPPRGGVTHDMVIDGHGYMYVSPPTKADISQNAPRISVATELRKEENISDLSSVTQESFHHGRGEREFDDPFAFFDSDRILSHISGQLTPPYADYVTVRSDAAASGSALVGPAGGEIGPGRTGVGAAVTSDAATDLKGHPVASILYNGNFYILVRGDLPADNRLFVWNNSTGEWDVVNAGLNTTVGDPSGLEIHDEDLYVAQGEDTNARFYDASAATWKDATVPADVFKSWDGRLWRADNINEIYFSSNPDAASPTWTLLGTIDDGSGTTPRIRNFATYGGNLLVFADFGVHQILSNGDGTYRIQPLLDDSAQRSPDNGSAVANFGGVIYYNVGQNITRYDGATRIDVSPNRSPTASRKFQPLPTNKQGVVRSMVATDTLLYAAIDAGDGRSTVMTYAGTGWHEFWQADADGNRCQWVFYTPALTTTGVLSRRNLWVNDGTRVRYIPLPNGSENPLNDPTVVYKAGIQCKLITGWMSRNLPALYKVAHELAARFDGLGTGEFTPNLHVYFQVDSGPDTFDISQWNYLATFSENPSETYRITNRVRHSAYPTAWGGAVGGLSYKLIRYMLVLDMDLGGPQTTTTPAVVYSFGERFSVRPQSRFGWTVVLKAYDEIVRLDGEIERGRSDAIIQELTALHRETLGPHYVDDGSLRSTINWLLNPSFEADSNGDGLADGWVKVGNPTVPTVSLDAKHKTHGSRSQKVVTFSANTGIQQTGLYVIPGVMSHAMARVFVEEGASVRLQVVDATTSAVYAESAPVMPAIATHPPVQFTSLHIHVPPSTILRNAYFRIIADGASTFYVDAAQYSIGDVVSHLYIDGDQPRCQWLGQTTTPYLSPSIQRGSYAVHITGMQEVIRSSKPTIDGDVVHGRDITLFLREI
jgi:hypothetical protein